MQVTTVKSNLSFHEEVLVNFNGKYEDSYTGVPCSVLGQKLRKVDCHIDYAKKSIGIS